MLNIPSHQGNARKNLEGAGGEGGGRGDWVGEDMWTQGLFISMYDRIDYK